MPSPHALAAIILTVVVFAVFAQGRLRMEVISLLLIGVIALGFWFFPLPGAKPSDGIALAFGGFGSEALVTISCMMIVGRGLVATGALDPLVQTLSRIWSRSNTLGLLSALLFAGGVSMFINDTPVMILTMPILLSIAARTGHPASQTLLPVNYAVLIGGMCTTIGTSTNLLVASIARDLGVKPIGIFDFVDIGLGAAIVALPYLWLIAPRLLPRYTSVAQETHRPFSASLYVEDGSAAIGLSFDEFKSLADADIRIYSLRRGQHVHRRTDETIRIQPGDILQVEGALKDLRHASDQTRTLLAPSDVLREIRQDPKELHVIAEVVVGADSALVGQTLRHARVENMESSAVIGLYRPDRSFYHEVLDTLDERIEAGDVLLVQGATERMRALQSEKRMMILEGAAEMPIKPRAPIAIIIAASVVAVATLRIVPISISSLAGAIAMIVTGCVSFERLGRALNAEVIVLVASSIALGKTVLATGAAAWMGGGLAQILEPLPAAASVISILCFSAFLTNFTSNNAAAAVTTPIAIDMAMRLGVPPEPMVLAVLFGSNLSYATPMAYQTNFLIMGPGGYQFKDYVRVGVPLLILMILVLTVLLVWKYQL